MRVMPNEGLVVLLFLCVGGHIPVFAICTGTLCLLIQTLSRENGE